MLTPHVDTTWLLMLDNEPIGLFFGHEQDNPINGQPVFQERLLYVLPKHRRYSLWFLKEMIKILKKEGFRMLIVGAIFNENLMNTMLMYHSLGFKDLEIHFFKDLTEGDKPNEA